MRTRKQRGGLFGRFFGRGTATEGGTIYKTDGPPAIQLIRGPLNDIDTKNKLETACSTKKYVDSICNTCNKYNNKSLIYYALQFNKPETAKYLLNLYVAYLGASEPVFPCFYENTRSTTHGANIIYLFLINPAYTRILFPAIKNNYIYSIIMKMICELLINTCYRTIKDNGNSEAQFNSVLSNTSTTINGSEARTAAKAAVALKKLLDGLNNDLGNAQVGNTYDAITAFVRKEKIPFTENLYMNPADMLPTPTVPEAGFEYVSIKQQGGKRRTKKRRSLRKTRRQRGGATFLGGIAHSIGFAPTKLIDSLENRTIFDAKVMKKIIEFKKTNNVTESTLDSSPEFINVKDNLREWVNNKHNTDGGSATALEKAENLLVHYTTEIYETRQPIKLNDAIDAVISENPALSHSIKVLKTLDAKESNRAEEGVITKVAIKKIMGHGSFVVADIDSMIKYPASVANNK